MGADMVSDINIQRWLSIGADPVHRLTLNGKAPLKKDVLSVFLVSWWPLACVVPAL